MSGGAGSLPLRHDPHVMVREDQAAVEDQGIHHETGTVSLGPGYAIPTRRTTLNRAVVRRELETIGDDLHANAVGIVGSDEWGVDAARRIPPC